MFSAFLLLFVKWRALHSECILRDTCDISEASAVYSQLFLWFHQPHDSAFKSAPCRVAWQSRFKIQTLSFTLKLVL